MKIILTMLVFLFLSACTSSGKKPADKMYYRFPENSLQPINKNITVKRPTAMGILGNRPMVAQTNDAALIQMSSNFWLESPKVLLRDYLDKIFQSNSEQDLYTLKSHILALEKKQDEAILSITFTLTDNNNTPILNKTYKRQTHLSNNTIASFSNAIAKMLKEMVQELSNDVQ